jgi:outer membrane protein TolC
MIRLLFFLAFISQPIWAAKTYSFQECIPMAVANNAELKTAEFNLRSAQNLENAATSGFYPRLSASVIGKRSDVEFEDAKSEYSTNLTLSQNVFSGFLDTGRVRQTSANTRASAAALQTAKAKLSFDLKSAFETFLFAKEFLKLSKSILERRSDNLRLVDLRFRSGRENKGSLLLAKAYLEQAKLDSLQAENAIQTSRNQLSKALGLDAEEEFDVSGSIPVQSIAIAKPNLKRLAVETPEYIQAAAQEDAADAGITVARAQFFPTLSVIGSTGQVGNSFYPGKDKWSVEANLSIPLFDGFRDYYNSASAAALTVASKQTKMGLERALLLKLQQAYSTFVETVQRNKVDESFEAAASLRAEIARNKYNNGLLNFDEWDLIESDLINRERASRQSRRDRVINEAAWEQAQGKGVIP